MGPHASVLEHWEIWSTDIYMPMGHTWSARPHGARVAVVHGTNREELEQNISEYVQDIDKHVYEARHKLDSLPADYRGEREVLECLISALAALRTGSPSRD
jgi:hypothetical protein